MLAYGDPVLNCKAMAVHVWGPTAKFNLDHLPDPVILYWLTDGHAEVIVLPLATIKCKIIIIWELATCILEGYELYSMQL